MDDGLHLVLAEGAFEEGLVGDIAADEGDAIAEAAAEEVGARLLVADEADDVGAEVDEAAHDPAADETGAAGDEGGSIAPERSRRASHTGAPGAP